MERKIQHETMSLTEEKKLIREIKQLNQQREHLAANTQRQQELYQAMGRRAETEERLKVCTAFSFLFSFFMFYNKITESP